MADSVVRLGEAEIWQAIAEYMQRQVEVAVRADDVAVIGSSGPGAVVALCKLRGVPQAFAAAVMDPLPMVRAVLDAIVQSTGCRVVRHQLTAGDGRIEIAVLPGANGVDLDVSISCLAGEVQR
ncbi:MAG: hypothetical protein PHX82_04680 [Paracoccaceae bacterium]|nr:hypothetical protein [Paracoccaceae bacterium]